MLIIIILAVLIIGGGLYIYNSSRCFDCGTNGSLLHLTKINKRIIIDGLAITPLEVVSDSRCSDICVWAGTVELRVKLENTVSTEVILTLGSPYIIQKQKVTLTNVFPAARQIGGPILPNEYGFEFFVTK